jgi:YidC/Oxa1 family membrane protein insertase
VTFYLLSNPFTEPLKAVLVWLAELASRLNLPDWFSEYAVAILLVAVIVKLVTQPLMSRQQASMRKMQELQPKINKLQKEHKDDREKLSQAQMELYREHGVNPFGGCLPLVVQMVVLFGLWRAIMGLAKLPDGSPGPMAGERFLWVPDLAACEPNPRCGAEFSVLPVAIPILIILMVISQILYQRVMTPPTQSKDSQQQAMQSAMKFMPLMFGFIFLTLPSGVVLYYSMFNIVGLVQQPIMDRFMRKSDDDVPDEIESTGKVIVDDDSAEGEDASEADTPAKEQKSYDRSKSRRRRKRKKNR